MLEGFRFLVDEAALRLAALDGPGDLAEAFERLVEVMQDLRGHGIAKFSLVWEEQLGEHALHEWLFDVGFGIDRVVANALQAALQRTPDWDDVCDTVGMPTRVSVDGVAHEAYSVSAAASATSGGRAIGCLSAVLSRRGKLPVVAGECASDVHFVARSPDALAFFRELPEIENLGEDAYFANATFAFPGLHFVRDRTHFRHFEEGYMTVRLRVTQHLAVLNDHARSILGATEPAATKQTRFGAHGVAASDENANTRANRAAMKQREVSVAGQLVVCDWHTKLRPHIDRIYFNATSFDRVVVGVFRDHLD